MIDGLSKGLEGDSLVQFVMDNDSAFRQKCAELIRQYSTPLRVTTRV